MIKNYLSQIIDWNGASFWSIMPCNWDFLKDRNLIPTFKESFLNIFIHFYFYFFNLMFNWFFFDILFLNLFKIGIISNLIFLDIWLIYFGNL